MMLEDRFGKRVRGGASPDASKDVLWAIFSGEFVCAKPRKGDRCDWSEWFEWFE
jgi:hypothetical protein